MGALVALGMGRQTVVLRWALTMGWASIAMTAELIRPNLGPD